MPYFDELVGRVKIQTTSKNTQRYYTTKRLIRDFIIQHIKFLCPCGRISQIFIYAECVTEVCEAERNWRGKSRLVNSSRTRQTGFCGLDHAITGAIYFTFHNEKKSSLDRPSYTSIQVLQFKIYVKKKGKKEIRFD